MKQTDAVWRTLADHALHGRREWPSTAELAWEAGVGQQLAYKALSKPVDDRRGDPSSSANGGLQRDRP